jgi:hypothetical protein
MSETYDGQDWIEAAKRMIREWRMNNIKGRDRGESAEDLGGICGTGRTEMEPGARERA